MGEIVTLNDGLYKFELPPLPKESDIWYYDVPKLQQFWKTPHNRKNKWLNPDGSVKNVKKMSERDKVEYITYWQDAWLNGLWVMINGVPTYLTGMHVEHLVFNRFKAQPFMYLDAQRERFYFRELTNNDPLCDGRCWIKCRRAGITTEEITEAIRCLLSAFQNNVSLQSDIADKARDTLLAPLIEVYVKRPEWMREVYYSSNGKVPRSKLELISSLVINDEDEYPLGGKASAYQTTAKAIDGMEFMLIIMDELSKWVGCSPMQAFEINKKTIVNPGKRGKADVLSTSGDSQAAMKATRDWHTLISNSDPRIRNANGRTNSGLYKFFVGAIHSMELTEILPGVLDIYGKINREMAEEFIKNDIEKYPKNSKEYVFACYKMPLEERHALLTVTSNNYFSKLRITNRLDELRGMPNDRKPYVRGKFDYSSSGKVFFVVDEFGPWLIAIHPYFDIEKGIDTRNRFRRDEQSGVCFPPINPEFGIGYDPFRYRKEDTVSTNLSNGSIIVYKKYDYYNSNEVNGFAGLYLDRPDDPNTAHKECAKACLYFGAPMSHERTIESVKTVFSDLNMLPFMKKSKKDGIEGMVIDSGGKVVKNGLDMMVARFRAPQHEDEKDQIASMPFEPCLEEMDGIDLAHTTSFDVFMSMVQLEYCLEQILFTPLTDQGNSRMLDVMLEIFPQRN